MPAPPSVSVVIPAFNAASVIAETLESVRAQTFKDFEVIIVDDGSTDDTAAIVRRFCEADPRFSLAQQPNSDVSAARNNAILRSQGGWIAFLDADDVWLPKKLERQLELSRTDPRANFLFTNLYFWDGQRDLYPTFRDDQPLPEGDIARGLIGHDVYGLSTVMVRREALFAVNLFDVEVSYCQDWDLWLRLGDHGLWARGIREPLVRYRRWPGSRMQNLLKLADGNVHIMERNLRATRHPEFRPLYRRALARALAEREVIRARPLVETDPAAVPPLIWRAWRHERRLKWLRWYLRLVWPKFLGGNRTAQFVHRKILERTKYQ